MSTQDYQSNPEPRDAQERANPSPSHSQNNNDNSGTIISLLNFDPHCKSQRFINR